MDDVFANVEEGEFRRVAARWLRHTILPHAPRDQNVILKIPAHDIAALVETGTAQPLVMGKRTMREWVIVEDPLAAATLKLLRASLAYVDTLPKTAPKKKK